MFQRATRYASMQVEAVGTSGGVVIQHWDDIGSPVLLKAHMRDVTLRQKLLRKIGNSTLGMLMDFRDPGGVSGGRAHAINLAERKKSDRKRTRLNSSHLVISYG